jgi:hypothetical protein
MKKNQNNEKNQLGDIDTEYEFSSKDEALEAFRYIVSNEWFG